MPSVYLSLDLHQQRSLPILNELREDCCRLRNFNPMTGRLFLSIKSPLSERDLPSIVSQLHNLRLPPAHDLVNEHWQPTLPLTPPQCRTSSRNNEFITVE